MHSEILRTGIKNFQQYVEMRFAEWKKRLEAGESNNEKTDQKYMMVI